MIQATAYPLSSRFARALACHALSVVLVAPATGGRVVLPGTPPRARLEHVAMLQGHFPTCPPWSPSGTQLVVRGEQGISIFDASRPADSARLVLPMRGGGVTVLWSPDGRWLACAVQAGASLEDPQVILALPAKGGRPDTLYRGHMLSPLIWGEDCVLYGWEFRYKGPSPLRAIPAPASWRAGYAGPARPWVTLIPWPSEGWSIRRFTTSPTPGVTTVPDLDSMQTLPDIELVERFPDGERFLVARGAPAFRTRQVSVIDKRGRTLRSLGRDVHWTSISADGRYLIGSELVVSDDAILGSNTYVGDAEGAWSVRLPDIQGGGLPCFSRQGWFVAYQTDSSRVGIGILRLEPR